MKTLVFASRNIHKIRELNDMVSDLGLSVCSISEISPESPDVDETGTTFFENAALKAIAAYRATDGLPSVADDSGICVHALDNAPGIFSARWAGEDEANNDKLLAELANHDDRGAHYHCSLALACHSSLIAPHIPPSMVHSVWPDLPTGAVLVETSGQVHGLITHERQGTGGFGYDPLFFLPELECTFAEVASEHKHELSHRGIAFRAMVDVIRGFNR